jgi:hypothetical protein
MSELPVCDESNYKDQINEINTFKISGDAIQFINSITNDGKCKNPRRALMEAWNKNHSYSKIDLKTVAFSVSNPEEENETVNAVSNQINENKKTTSPTLSSTQRKSNEKIYKFEYIYDNDSIRIFEAIRKPNLKKLNKILNDSKNDVYILHSVFPEKVKDGPFMYFTVFQYACYYGYLEIYTAIWNFIKNKDIDEQIRQVHAKPFIYDTIGPPNNDPTILDNTDNYGVYPNLPTLELLYFSHPKTKETITPKQAAMFHLPGVGITVEQISHKVEYKIPYTVKYVPYSNDDIVQKDLITEPPKPDGIFSRLLKRKGGKTQRRRNNKRKTRRLVSRRHL